MRTNEKIVKIFEIKGPVNIAKVLVENDKGAQRSAFVTKEELPVGAVVAYHKEIRDEGGRQI